MRVFILGAGASAHAGYPLTGGLGDALIRFAAEHPRPDALTWPTKEELEREFPSGCDVEAVFTRLAYSKGTLFLEHLRSMICDYFDSIATKRNAVLYKRFASFGVSHGDVIITFNYDVSLELALREAGIWEIYDGYGFLIEGISGIPSPVKVLKLHGSSSWIDVVMTGGPGVFSMINPDQNRNRFTPQILPMYFELFGYADDVRNPSFRGGATARDFRMILPILEKDFDGGKELWDKLWHQAEDALRAARQIVILGYSLPLSDARARSLILDHGSKDASVFCCCQGDNKRLLQEFQSVGFGHTAELSDFESWLNHVEHGHRSTTM